MARSTANASVTITALDRTRAGINSAREGLGSLDSTVSRLTGGFSLLGVAAAFVPAAAIASNANYIQQLGQMSKAVGISVAELQGLRAEAGKFGVEAQTVDDALTEMQLRLSEASFGMGEAVDALSALGLSAEELKRLSPADQFGEIAKALDGVKNSADKISFADQLLGSDSRELLAVLPDNVRKTTAALDEMGLTLTGVDTSAVTAMNIELGRTGKIVGASARVFTSELAPAITGTLKSISLLGGGFLNARESSELFADGAVAAVGFVGETINAVTRGVVGLAAVQSESLLSIAQLIDRIPGVDLTEKITGAQEVTDRLAGMLGAIPEFGEFRAQLQEQVASARAEAERLGAEMEAAVAGSGSARIMAPAVAAEEFEKLRDSLRNERDMLDAELQSQLEVIDKFAKLFPERIAEADAARRDALRKRNEGMAELIEKQAAQEAKLTKPFDDVVAQNSGALMSENDKIESEYRRQIDIITAFSQQYPQRMAEATEAQKTAILARREALAELEEKETDQKALELAPLVANLEAMQASEMTATETILAEREKRGELLAELVDKDASYAMAANDAYVDYINAGERRITEATRREKSNQIQEVADYAAASLGIASSLVTSLGGQSERSKKISARTAQAEALVAGISAAERARNHATAAGGFIGGAAAAALSWAATLANVAGIEAALQGGRPSGAASGGGGSASSSGGGASSEQLLRTEDDRRGPTTTVYQILSADEIVDQARLAEAMRRAVAEGTQSRQLVYDDRRRVYVQNEEAA